MSNPDSGFEPILIFLTHALTVVENIFYKVPGSAVLVRYVKSSHQNDPGRTVLELILFLFAIGTLLQSRTRADTSGKNFVKYTEEVSQCLLYMGDRHVKTEIVGNRRTG